MADKNSSISGMKPNRYLAEKNRTENAAVRSKLNNDIKNGSFEKVYLLYGEESFLRRSYKTRLKSLLIGDDDINYTEFEGPCTDPEQVLDIALTAPFFSERRLVVIQNTGWFSVKEASAAHKILEALPETTYIIFCESSVDRRYGLYKKVCESGYAARLDYLTYDELCLWTGKKLKSDGFSVEKAAADLIVDSVGTDMTALSNEIDKIASYAYSRGEVTVSDVKEIGIYRLNDRLFEMIDMACEGRMKPAMEIYDELLALRIPPIKTMIIIGRHVSNLITIKELAARGTSDREIAAMTGIRDFVIRKARKQISVLSDSKLKRLLAMTVEMDERIKSGIISDQLAVELILVELCKKEP